MAFNSAQDMIIGTIGRVNDLRELNNDNAVVNFSVAVTPRKRDPQNSKNWIDDETIWTNCVIWGRDARAFAASQLAPGTQVIVHGTRRAVRRPAYTTKSGTEVPERVEQELTVDMVAVAINPFVTVQVTRLNTNGNGSPVPQKPNTATQARPASKPARSAAPDPVDQTADDSDPFNQPDPFASDDSGDAFADDGNASDDSDDPFANIF